MLLFSINSEKIRKNSYDYEQKIVIAKPFKISCDYPHNNFCCHFFLIMNYSHKTLDFRKNATLHFLSKIIDSSKIYSNSCECKQKKVFMVNLIFLKTVNNSQNIKFLENCHSLVFM